VLPAHKLHMHTNHTWLGLARTIYVYGVYTVILAGKSPNLRCIYTYIYTVLANPTHGSACTQITHAHKSRMACMELQRCLHTNYTCTQITHGSAACTQITHAHKLHMHANHVGCHKGGRRPAGLLGGSQQFRKLHTPVKRCFHSGCCEGGRQPAG